MANRHSGCGVRPEDMPEEECSGTTLPILLTLGGLLLSVVWVGAILYASPFSAYLRSVIVMVCALVCGLSLYTIKATNGWSDWADIRPLDKTIAVITLTAGLAILAATCCVCYWYTFWAQGTSERPLLAPELLGSGARLPPPIPPVTLVYW
jgi:hypothetical protein